MLANTDGPFCLDIHVGCLPSKAAADVLTLLRSTKVCSEITLALRCI